MAEIKIERKRRSALPWVLGVVALAVVAFVLFRVMGGRQGAAPAADDTHVVVDSARP